ncbi:hypothetical protein WJ47_12465 [Burkholderia ubonensis]|uniref:Tyr recombinase domain-containing protein n=1 Tax=Burkholderia ubonensis TaxID=101571 RepID=A0AB73FQX4_9BURK|nr:site-specific integrase [Burkholderia ubonensis]KVK87634.1 hypothetical protein WJ44_32935 [Burkholderia ubonensis]KVL66162.1 hypothetical protein WJ47_12465 [Burkholderia ubonensis]KVM19897.1 hypothetical protein WJ53_22535 [Burkholderia ubonensis]KVM26782.1 hypothetical protein WJ54_16150 [Burkholderia ubonensis]
MEPKRAKTLSPSQIRHLLRVTDATSRHPERDVLVLLLGFTCGMRVSEIAQIEVADVLLPSGRAREEVSLRSAITKGSKARCVYLSNPKAVAALERYIEWRWNHGKATALDRSKWRGLMPHVPLILTHKGARYELSVKRRVNYDGETVDYLAADSLQNYITGLYRAAGFGRGFSSHSGLYASGAGTINFGLHDASSRRKPLFVVLPNTLRYCILQ